MHVRPGAQSRVVFESISLRDESVPDLLVVVRLGSNTLLDEHLARSTAECHARWGIWGFSVLEVPGGDYGALVGCAPSSRPAVVSSWRTEKISPRGVPAAAHARFQMSAGSAAVA